MTKGQLIHYKPKFYKLIKEYCNSQAHDAIHLCCMITKEYEIIGMTCQGCVAKVQETISNMQGVKSTFVQLDYPQAKIVSENPIDLGQMNALFQKQGKYSIRSLASNQQSEDIPESTQINISIYKPLILVISFVAGVSLLVQFPFETINLKELMRHFMGGFFIAFSFFKFLNIKGFASSFKMYDPLAKLIPGWAYVYPFLELGIGILFIINQWNSVANGLTIVILGIGTIGVVQSVMDKRKIKCACLGDVFNLPMTTVTIVENVSMITMAVIALIF